MSDETPVWVPTKNQPQRAPAGGSWADFTKWVDWFDDAYELQFPKCWFQHEGVVHTLTALWEAWHAVYSRIKEGDNITPAPSPTAAASFHVQFLHPTLRELFADGKPLQMCASGYKHIDYAPRNNEPSRLPKALDEYVEQIMNEPTEPTCSIRGESERKRFDELIQTEGSSAIISLLYPPKLNC